MCTATSATDSKEKKLPAVFISQTKTPMKTDKQKLKEARARIRFLINELELKTGENINLQTRLNQFFMNQENT